MSTTERSIKGGTRVLHFTLSSVGPQRSESEMLAEVEAARKEAVERVFKEWMEAKVEPEGRFLGAGVDWVWVLHVAHPYLEKMGEAALAAATGAAVKDLYRYLKEGLLKRNIIVSEESEDADEDTKKSEKPKPKKQNAKSKGKSGKGGKKRKR